MARITWDGIGSRLYDAGIDRGVLFVGDQPGVPWNGLTALTENISGGTAKPIYLDGEKVSNLASREEFQATLAAFTYPDEFAQCDGTLTVRPGLFVTAQKRKVFSLTYRTMIGNDQTENYAYRIHIIYNVLASPSSHGHKTMNSSSDPDDFSWTLTTVPVDVPGYRRTAHVVLDSRTFDTRLFALIEDMLYGTDADFPRVPSIVELLDLVDTNGVLTVTDNGDGTFTMTAPMHELYMIDGAQFQITWPTVVFIDADTYTATSS